MGGCLGEMGAVPRYWTTPRANWAEKRKDSGGFVVLADDLGALWLEDPA